MKKRLKVIVFLLLFAVNAGAKRDFYVFKEIWCGDDEICYTVADNQRLTGKLRLYHFNGQVQSDNDYVNGLRHGVRVTYDKEGHQRSYLLYQNGKLNGMSVSYFTNGNVELETEFTDNKINGTNRRYYEDGTLRREEIYTNGVLNGRLREFYENGKLFLEVYYNNGEIYQAKCRTTNGKIIDFTMDKELYIASGKTPCGSR